MLQTRLALGMLFVVGMATACPLVPRTISAIGFSGNIANTGLARTTAANRALNGLHKLLSPLDFEWTKDEMASQLELRLAEGRLSAASTEFYPLEDGHWLAQARMAVPWAVAERHRAIGALEAHATVSNDDLSAAYMIAESRALRSLIEASVGAPVPSGIHSGRLDLTDLIVDIDGVTVTVRAKGRATLQGRAEIPEDARQKLLTSALDEHRIAGDREVLAALLEHAALRDDASGRHQLAADRYSEAATLDADRRDHFAKLELEALRASGAPEAAPRIQVLEAELGQAAD